MRIGSWPIWLSVLLAMNFVPGIASAGDDSFAPRCEISVDHALKSLLEGAPDAVVYEFRGRDARVGIRIFNQLPPTGHNEGDRFYIAVRPYFPISRLIVGKDGCVANAMLVDLRVAAAIKKAIKLSGVASAAL
jgi:hypothetical protein